MGAEDRTQMLHEALVVNKIIEITRFDTERVSQTTSRVPVGEIQNLIKLTWVAALG